MKKFIGIWLAVTKNKEDSMKTKQGMAKIEKCLMLNLLVCNVYMDTHKKTKYADWQCIL